MGVDYTKFKTPYFEIKIGDSKGQRLVPLPHHILRLVSKIEIMETFEEGQFNTVNITFVEGSREPASPDANLGTDGLYKITNSADGQGDSDMDISGSLTNRTGIITDLRFSGKNGITFITKEEQRKNTIDTTKQKNVNNKSTTRAHKREEARPTLIFQERNQIQVIWGYKEDPSSERKVRAYIVTVNVKYPESGPVETTIIAQDTGSALDQLALNKGTAFGKRLNTPAGNSIINVEDKTTDELIRDICKQAGIPAIVSGNLPFPTMDRDRQKIWLMGDSFHQFMTKLAKQHGCYYKVVPNPDTGLDTLFFIKHSDFERYVRVDKSLLTYKAPNSILKRAEINVDFGGLQGSGKAGYDTEGNNDKVEVQTPQENSVMFKNDVIIDANPISGVNPIKAAEGIYSLAADKNSEVAWTPPVTEVTPLENVSNKEAAASTQALANNRLIQLTFSTIGYTKLTPGTVEIAGLGVRYSGKYRIVTCTHTISSSGYETECKALSMALTNGGILDPKALIQDDIPVEQENRQMFKEDSSSEQNTIRQQYDKAYGVPK